MGIGDKGGGPSLGFSGVPDFPGGNDPYHPGGPGPGGMVNVTEKFLQTPAGYTSAVNGLGPTQSRQSASTGYGGAPQTSGVMSPLQQQALSMILRSYSA